MSEDNTPAEDPVAAAEELLAAVEDPQTAEQDADSEPLPEPVVDDATRVELARVYALLLALRPDQLLRGADAPSSSCPLR